MSSPPIEILIGIGIVSTVIGGLILTGVLRLIRVYWPDSPIGRRLRDRRTRRESERLLVALREMAREAPGDDLDTIVLLVEDAARRANVKDPTAAEHHLLDRGLIAAHSAQPTPVYVRLTRSGFDG